MCQSLSKGEWLVIREVVVGSTSPCEAIIKIADFTSNQEEMSLEFCVNQ